MDALEWIHRSESLRIRQKVEWSEVFTGFEMNNRYVIDDGHERFLLHAAESGAGVGKWLTRQTFKNQRPFTIQIFDPSHRVVVEADRLWPRIFARMLVRDRARQPLGTIQQRFSLLRRRFVIEDPYGMELATIHGPLLRPWTFSIETKGSRAGHIKKRWSGLAKEAMSAPDNYTVQLGPGLPGRTRVLCLCAAFLIDFLYFERR